MCKKKYKNIVIGSGISALGAILALVKKKREVLLIDTNDNFYFDKKKTIFCEQSLPLHGILNWKTLNIKKLLKIKAFGGHSNIWGGSSLKLCKNEFKTWPLNYKEIIKYYKICEKILNIKSEEIKFLKKNSESLYFKESKIALNNNGAIFNSKDIILNLIEKKKIYFFRGNVKKITNRNNKIKIIFYKSKDYFFCDKIYIGAGPYNTQKILKNSLNEKKFYPILQSQSFFAPVLFFTKQKDYQCLIHKKFSNNQNLHLEFKKSNLLHDTLRKRYYLLSLLIPKILYKNVYIITGFIPSTHSTNINKNFNINKITQDEIKKKIFNTFNFLEKELKIMILSSFFKFTNFGRSFHIGANIPMTERTNNSYYTTDKTGILSSKFIKNIYIIDSSVFPNIPSGTLGITSMANAYRIATESN